MAQNSYEQKILNGIINDRRENIPGRREKDGHVCVFHDDFKTQNLNCLIAIKDRIKMLEDKMSGTVTVKIAGIITTVAMGFLILFIGAAFSMMRDFSIDVENTLYKIDRLEEKQDNLLESNAIMSTKQQGVIETIRNFRNDLREIKAKMENQGE